MARDTSSKLQSTGTTEQSYFALLSAACVTLNCCSGKHGVCVDVLGGYLQKNLLKVLI